MSTNCTAGEGASWPSRWATSMVLPNPDSPATTMPETSARRIMTKVPSSAHPSHQEVRDAGAVPDRSIRAGARSRVAVQATELDPAGALLGGPDRNAPPGVSQVADDVLVVAETGAWDGGHRRGHALVVDGEVGGGEAVLAGPLVLVAEPQGLGQ